MATSSAAIPECLPSIMLICSSHMAAAALREGRGILGRASDACLCGLPFPLRTLNVGSGLQPVNFWSSWGVIFEVGALKKQ